MGTGDKLGDQPQQVAKELNANRAELRACADLPHLYVLNKPQAARHRDIHGYRAWGKPRVSSSEQCSAISVEPPGNLWK